MVSFILFICQNQNINVFSLPGRLSQRLMDELIVFQSLWRPSARIFKHLWNHRGQSNSNFIWRLLRTGERKFVQMVLVTWPRWSPRPYVVNSKYLLKIFFSSPEPEGQWPWDLVCSIGDVWPTEFVQMMMLGWPWPT